MKGMKVVEKILSMVLSILVVMALAGCHQSENLKNLDSTEEGGRISSEENQQEIVSNINSESPEFLEMQIPIEAPIGAEDVVYQIIGAEVVEIKFTLGKCEYVMRGSKTLEGEALHGVHEPVEDEVLGIESDGENCSCSMTIYTMKQGGQIGTNTINIRDRDTIYLTLVTMDEKAESLETMLSQISSQVVECFESRDDEV